MPNGNPKKVAMRVVEKRGKGEKVILGKIMKEVGYADASCKNPINVTKTKEYREIVDPFIAQMERIRKKAADALEKKALDYERATDLSTIVKQSTHDIQLLGGKPTENILIIPTYEEAERVKNALSQLDE